MAAVLVIGSLQGCARSTSLEPAKPHGSSTVRYVLRNPAFDWRTYHRPDAHFHVAAGSYTAEHVAESADSALLARDYVLKLLETREDTATLEIFLVDSRDDMKRLAGQRWAGWAQPGEKTAFFVAGKGYRPAFRHELMHAYSLSMWGEPASGPWITEGIAAWATGDCQGKSFDGLVAGFAKTDSIYSLTTLISRFRELPELRGYFQAASLVETIHRSRGIEGVRETWKHKPSPGEHPLGPNGPRIEAEWRARIAAATPAVIDSVALDRDGC